MGNCCAGNTSATSDAQSATQSVPPKKKQEEEIVKLLPDVIDESCTLGALFQSIMPIVLPIVRMVVSKNCVDDKMVLRDEVEIQEINVSKEEELILEPLEFDFGHVSIVDKETMEKDVEASPEFKWPVLTTEEDFCLDLTGVRLKIVFGRGIEFKLPVDGPLGMKADLEIGTGDAKSDVKQAWFEITIPRVRMWYSNVEGARKAHVAFMARPKFTPNIHVNVDRGKGDFMSMDFQEHDGLDDTIETVLCGFGPSSLTRKKEGDEEKEVKSSWVADAIGASISSMISTFAGMDATDAPLEIDLEESIAEAIRIALGKPRPVEAIEADIERLQNEKKKHETHVKPDQAEEEEKSRDVAGSGDIPNPSSGDAKDEEKIPENRSTGAFFRTLLPIVLPIVRQVVSKGCVSDGMVLRNEEKVTKINIKNEEELVIEPLELELGNTRVVQLANYEKDMKAMPEFDWPKMTPDGFVWDIVNLRLKITWAQGVEFAFPADGPMGIKAMLEIGGGSGRSDVKQAWVELLIPKLRICYDNVKPNRKAYVFFMARPKVSPNLHVNADRGKGDFMSMDFQEHDGLDDTIESILCGFGPSSLTKKKLSKEEKKNQKSSWIADGIGKRISRWLKTFSGLDGTDAPLVIDLEETMKVSVDSAMGVPRPHELIDSDIEVLAAELKVSQEYYAKESAEEEKKEDDEEAAGGGNSTNASRDLPIMEVDNTQIDSSGILDACCGAGFSST